MKNSDTRSLASSYGFCPLATNLVNKVEQKMQESICNGVYIARNELIPQHKGGGFTALFILASVGILVTVLLVTIYFLNPIQSSISEDIYVVVSELGTIIGFVGVILWALQPLNDFVCLGRAWLTSLAMAIIMASLCARLFQIFMIFRFYLTFRQVNRTHLNLWLICSFCVIISFQLVIMILWSAIDKYRRLVVVDSALNFTDDLKCESNNLGVWMGLQIGYFGIVTIISIFIIYATWEINNKFGTARWTVMSVYNLILAVVVVIPIILVGNNTDSYRSIVIGYGLFFLSFSSSFTSMFPKIYHKISIRNRNSRESSIELKKNTSNGENVQSKIPEKECQEVIKAIMKGSSKNLLKLNKENQDNKAETK